MPNPDIRKVLGQNTIQDIPSDEDDEELIYHVSQVEKEVLEMDRSQKQVPESQDINYSEFQGKKPTTSTQLTSRGNFKEPAAPNVLPSQISQLDSNKENVSQLPFQNRILSNKCRALELTVKRLGEQLQNKKMQASQEVSKHSHEVERMRQRMIQLEKENNKLRQDHLIGLSQQPVNNDLQQEVDNLREQVKSLMKVKEENNILKNSIARTKESGETSSPKVDPNDDWINIAFAPNLSDHVTNKIKPPKLFAPDFTKPKQLCDYQLELQYTINEFISLTSEQKENFDTCWLIFQHLFIVVRDLCECVRDEEVKRECEIIKRTDFRSRQAELISIQIEHDNLSEPPEECDDDTHMIGLENKQQALKIRLIGMMAVLARESCTLSMMIASVNVFTLCETSQDEEVTSLTLLDMFSSIIEKFFIPSRQYFEFYGIAHGLATLGCGISRHYNKFDDYKIVDVTLSKFLNSILAITLNSAQILIKLTEFVSNLAKGRDSKLFTSLCINSPSSNIKRSLNFKLLQIPLDGCMFQILFMLIVNAFPQYEELPRHRLDLLFKLTENLNILTQQIILHGDFIKFLQSNHKFGSSDSCMCLNGLISSLVTLHSIILDHTNFDFDRYKFQIKSAVRSFVMSMKVLLSQARQSKNFDDCDFVLNKMSSIYITLRHDSIYEEETGNIIKAYDFYFKSNGSAQVDKILRNNLESLNLDEKRIESEEIDEQKEELLKKIIDMSLQRAIAFIQN